MQLYPGPLSHALAGTSLCDVSGLCPFLCRRHDERNVCERTRPRRAVHDPETTVNFTIGSRTVHTERVPFGNEATSPLRSSTLVPSSVRAIRTAPDNTTKLSSPGKLYSNVRGSHRQSIAVCDAPGSVRRRSHSASPIVRPSDVTHGSHCSAPILVRRTRSAVIMLCSPWFASPICGFRWLRATDRSGGKFVKSRPRIRALLPLPTTAEAIDTCEPRRASRELVRSSTASVRTKHPKRLPDRGTVPD